MAESSYQISSTSEASPQDVQAVLTGLRGYNEMHAGPAHFTAVHLFLRDSRGAVRGCLLAKRIWGWLYVDSLWVDDSLRGHRWGRRLLRQAETEAQQAGCTRALLDTFDFQARPFYEREGYTIFGIFEGFPPGHSRYYMQKELVPGPGSETSSSDK